MKEEKRPITKFGTRSLDEVRISVENPSEEVYKILVNRGEQERNRKDSSR